MFDPDVLFTSKPIFSKSKNPAWCVLGERHATFTLLNRGVAMEESGRRDENNATSREFKDEFQVREN